MGSLGSFYVDHLKKGYPNSLLTNSYIDLSIISLENFKRAQQETNILCRELVCITVKWTWYNGRDKFFHITSGRINTWKGVNQLKELFFLNLIIFF